MMQARTRTAEVKRVIMRPPSPDDLEVSAVMTMNADARRVANALAITEYMDAWMHMPETDEFLCTAPDVAPDQFGFDLYSSRKLRSSIRGYCLLSTAEHLVYVWSKAPCGAVRETVVDIHLQQVSDQCTVKLKHSGLSSMTESLWHATMWKRSLENLRRLMEA